MKTSLDDLIEEITCDAYGEEGYWAFLTAFDDAVTLPTTAKLLAESVEVSKIDFDGNERRGLMAVVTRGKRGATVSLLDLQFPARSKAARCQAAYRRWLGVSKHGH